MFKRHEVTIKDNVVFYEGDNIGTIYKTLEGSYRYLPCYAFTHQGIPGFICAAVGQLLGTYIDKDITERNLHEGSLPEE